MEYHVIARSSFIGLATAIALGGAACGDLEGTGQAPSYLFIERLTGISGASPDAATDVLASDVQTQGTVLEDLGEVTLRLAVKDIGQPGNPNAPSPNNLITVRRYSVQFRRSDGRNTPGVDVPYPFDGGVTGTVTTSPAVLTFVLVRVQAKLEAPLRALRGAGSAIAISTIADITFYGRDQAGNDTSVSGSISVTFADWADPK